MDRVRHRRSQRLPAIHRGAKRGERSRSHGPELQSRGARGRQAGDHRFLGRVVRPVPPDRTDHLRARRRVRRPREDREDGHRQEPEHAGPVRDPRDSDDPRVQGWPRRAADPGRAPEGGLQEDGRRARWRRGRAFHPPYRPARSLFGPGISFSSAARSGRPSSFATWIKRASSCGRWARNAAVSPVRAATSTSPQKLAKRSAPRLAAVDLQRVDGAVRELEIVLIRDRAGNPPGASARLRDRRRSPRAYRDRRSPRRGAATLHRPLPVHWVHSPPPRPPRVRSAGSAWTSAEIAIGLDR